MDKDRLLVYLALAHDLNPVILEAIAPSLHTKQSLWYHLHAWIMTLPRMSHPRGMQVVIEDRRFILERAQKGGFIFKVENAHYVPGIGFNTTTYSWINYPKINSTFVDVPTLVHGINLATSLN